MSAEALKAPKANADPNELFAQVLVPSPPSISADQSRERQASLPNTSKGFHSFHLETKARIWP